MANTTRGRVWRELFLVAFVATFLVPWGAATANMSAQLENDVYGWEPLGVIAGSSELRLHSLGTDVWEVWVCDTPAGDLMLDPVQIAQVLTSEIKPFYEWLSEGRYQPEFRGGGTAVEGSGCADAVAERVTSEPNGVIIVTDTASNGGSAQSGIWCPYEGLCPASPATYPENYRSVTLGAHAVIGPNPRFVTVVHELGHTLHFGHIFSGQTTGTWSEYDDPTDVMSKAGDRTKLMGTAALHRYIAGWLDPDEVVIADGAGSYTLEAIGGNGDQLLLVPNGEQGWLTAVDVRIRSDYDTALPMDGVTVHTLDQRAEACGSALPCFGLSRRVAQWPPEPDSYDHVLAAGDDVVLPGGWTLTVRERVGDLFVVDLSDTSAPVFVGPLVATGIEASSVALAWPAAVDPEPVGYEVGVVSEPPLVTSETSAVLTGLAPDTAYDFRIAAVDASGNRVALDPIQVRTLTARDNWVAHGAGTGRWSFRLGAGVETTIYYGVPGDIALFCDWDGDGTDTVGLYRSGEGFVYLRNSNTLGFADLDFFFGIPTDVPVCGDWDGDGVDTIGVYRPSERRFFLRNSNSLGFADIDFEFGLFGDQPLAGDWDGDGVDTVALYRAANSAIYGVAGEVWPVDGSGQLVVGDPDGDGRDGFANFSDGVIRWRSGDAAQQLVRFGTAGSVALAGWWS
ncbi:MAG: hypothetical protein HKO82_02500 [Acidimicrobiia bacterium]|nr:hypothetical protein [Acidimicrobiia bacterium]